MEPHTQSPETPVEPHVTAKKSINVSVPAAIITGAAIIGLAIFLTFGAKGSAPIKQASPTPPTTPTSVAADIATVRQADYIRGERTADVVIIEYSDSDCPYCQKFHTTLKEATSAYGKKVAWVYRHFPLNIHPNAFNEAVASSCVAELGGNSAFWTYTDTIMNVTLSPDPKSNEALTTFATQAGVNADLFKTCLKDPKISKGVDESIEEAKRAGARGTPYSIAVNTKTGKQVVIPGAMELANVKGVIDSLLK